MTNEPEATESSAAPAAAAAPEVREERPRDRDDRPRDRDDRPRDRDDRPRDRDDRERGGRGRPRGRRGCEFCPPGTKVVDYKDVSMLRRYLTERGKIEARRRGGCPARCQRMLAQAIKRARHMALLPYTAEHVRVGGVPAGRGGRR